MNFDGTMEISFRHWGEKDMLFFVRLEVKPASWHQGFASLLALFHVWYENHNFMQLRIITGKTSMRGVWHFITSIPAFVSSSLADMSVSMKTLRYLFEKKYALELKGMNVQNSDCFDLPTAKFKFDSTFSQIN